MIKKILNTISSFFHRSDFVEIDDNFSREVLFQFNYPSPMVINKIIDEVSNLKNASLNDSELIDVSRRSANLFSEDNQLLITKILLEEYEENLNKSNSEGWQFSFNIEKNEVDKNALFVTCKMDYAENSGSVIYNIMIFKKEENIIYYWVYS